MTKYEFENKKYSLIVANTIIDHLEKDEGDVLITKLKESLIKGGVIFASVFTVNDPGNNNLPFHSETAQYVKRYFFPGELRNKFSGINFIAISRRGIS